MAQMTVCRATNADRHRLGRAIARAFQDDSALAWAVPDAQRRKRFGPRYFEVLIEHAYLPKGEVYVTNDAAAAALWAPPHNWQTSAAGPKDARHAEKASMTREKSDERHDR